MHYHGMILPDVWQSIFKKYNLVNIEDIIENYRYIQSNENIEISDNKRLLEELLLNGFYLELRDSLYYLFLVNYDLNIINDLNLYFDNIIELNNCKNFDFSKSATLNELSLNNLTYNIRYLIDIKELNSFYKIPFVKEKTPKLENENIDVSKLVISKPGKYLFRTKNIENVGDLKQYINVILFSPLIYRKDVITITRFCLNNRHLIKLKNSILYLFAYGHSKKVISRLMQHYKSIDELLINRGGLISIDYIGKLKAKKIIFDSLEIINIINEVPVQQKIDDNHSLDNKNQISLLLYYGHSEQIVKRIKQYYSNIEDILLNRCMLDTIKGIGIGKSAEIIKDCIKICDVKMTSTYEISQTISESDYKFLIQPISRYDFLKKIFKKCDNLKIKYIYEILLNYGNIVENLNGASKVRLNNFLHKNNKSFHSFLKQEEKYNILLELIKNIHIFLSDELVDRNEFLKHEVFKKYGKEANLILDALIGELIIQKGSKIKLKRNDVSIVLNTLSEREVEIFKLRAQGETLDNIGKMFGLTRERVRQIVKKSMDRILSSGEMFIEELYKDVFQQYDWSQKLFEKYIDNGVYTYYYLCNKYDRGIVEPIYYVKRNKIDFDINDFHLEEKHFIYNGNFYLKSDMLNVFLDICIDDSVYKVNELYSKFKIFTDEINIETKDFRSFKGRIGRSKMILGMEGYRKFDFDITDDMRNELYSCIINKIDKIYSSYYFFIKEKELMDKIKIYDHYELYSLLKRINDNDNVIFTRVPTIFNTNYDYELFFDEVIKEYKITKIHEIVDFIHENYGHKKNTTQALLGKYYSITNNCIDIINKSVCVLTTEEINKLNIYLKENVYSTEEFYNILLKNDINLRPNFADFKKLGYLKACGMVLKSNSDCLIEHFRQLATQNRYIMKSTIDLYKLKSKGSYIYSIVNELRKKYILFSFDEKRYISGNSLIEIGLTKSLVNKNINKILKHILDEFEFFNIFYLRNMKHPEIVEALEYFDSFYLSDLLIQEFISINERTKHLNLDRYGDSKIFSKTTKSILKRDFLQHIISTNTFSSSMIIDLIKERYDVIIDKYYLRNMLEKSGYFYSAEFDKFYKDKKYYYEEIKQYE